MLRVVAPVDQSQEAASGAVSTTSSPEQNVVGPSAVITGIGGFALTVRVAGSELAEFPPAQLVIWQRY